MTSSAPTTPRKRAVEASCAADSRHALAAGGVLSIVFLDVFQFRGDLVGEKRSYAMQAA